MLLFALFACLAMRLFSCKHVFNKTKVCNPYKNVRECTRSSFIVVKHVAYINFRRKNDYVAQPQKYHGVLTENKKQSCDRHIVSVISEVDTNKENRVAGVWYLRIITDRSTTRYDENGKRIHRSTAPAARTKCDYAFWRDSDSHSCEQRRDRFIINK